MRFHVLAISLVLGGALTLPAACGNGVAATTSGGGMGAGGSCGAADDTCKSDGDCCSKACVDGTCLDMCFADFADCSQDAECCGKFCDATGTCGQGTRPIPETCAIDTDSCSASGDCCSFNCGLSFRISQFSFCLAFKLRSANFYRNNCS